MAGIALYKQKHLWIVEVDNVLQTFCKSIRRAGQRVARAIQSRARPLRNG